VVVNLPDKPSEVQDVNLTVDGVAGNNSDPEPIETDNAQNNTDNNGVGQQQGTQMAGTTGANTPDANTNSNEGASSATGQNPILMQQGSSATPQSNGSLSPTSDGVVNQILGQDQGMLPVVKGGAGAGLR